MSIQYDGISYEVKRVKPGLLLAHSDHVTGEIIEYFVSTEQAEELRKQLDEALKDPLEGYGLPWDYAAKTNWLRTIDLAIVAGPGQGTIARAFASLSEAEQREFLMRGLS